MTAYINAPWRLVPNSFIRYPGGQEIERFRGKTDASDTMRSEAWIGSDTTVDNVLEGGTALDGLAECFLPDGRRMLVREAIQIDPYSVLGPDHQIGLGDRLGILMKFLDPLNQLELQVHPNREYARRFLGCDFGKTECWYIAGLRKEMAEPHYVYLGFKEGISREMFTQLYLTGNIAGMEQCCHKVQVQVGEMYFIAAGLPHAVGPGCFVLELQEASDTTFTVYKPQDRQDDEFNEFTDLCMNAFDFTGRDLNSTLAAFRIDPITLRYGEWGKEQLLIGAGQTEYFSLTILEAIKPVRLEKSSSFRICTVLAGGARLIWGNGEMVVQQADEFLIPWQADALDVLPLDSGVRIIIGFPGR